MGSVVLFFLGFGADLAGFFEGLAVGDAFFCLFGGLSAFAGVFLFFCFFGCGICPSSWIASIKLSILLVWSRNAVDSAEAGLET